MRSRRSAGIALVIGLVLLVAPLVTSGGAVGDERSDEHPSVSTGSVAARGITQSAPPDPVTDTLGWENGYWYNESIDIDQTDGLSESELDAFRARSMARVEYIRRLEFTDDVEVVFVRPEEISAPRNDMFGLSTNDQLWEALFFYGESTNATRAVREAQSGAVLGFAAEEGSDRIVIVGQPAEPTVSGATLVHELAHMLQDQQFNLSQPRYQRSTLDGEFAKDGLVEGEAAYITERYRQRCQRTWQCVEQPPNEYSGHRSGSDRFYHLTYFPYSAGKLYVQRLVETSGWMAVTGNHARPPASTEQVIHPQTGDQPLSLSVSDTSRNGWHRLTTPETVGEAGIYSLFWRRSGTTSTAAESNSGANRSETASRAYVSRPSSGWGSDRLYTYASGEKRGYVWKTRWDTERDAREFRDAYIDILTSKGATRHDAQTWRIDSGPFADVFSVKQTGTTVTIVNGPTTDALRDIHPKTTDTKGKNSETASQNETTNTTGDGFGGFVALVALVLVGLMRHN